jgi:hypothetical protein
LKEGGGRRIRISPRRSVFRRWYAKLKGQGVSDKSFEVTLIARKIIEDAHCTQSTVAITPQFQDVAQGTAWSSSTTCYTRRGLTTVYPSLVIIRL